MISSVTSNAAPTGAEPLIDCRGLQCPAPILKLAEAARKHRGSGATLTVLATDADFPVDLDAWCRTTKSSLVRLDHEPDGAIRARIRLAGAPAPAPVPASDTLSTAPRATPPAAPVPAPVPAASASASSAPQRLDLTGLPLGAAMRKVGEISLSHPGERWTVLSDAHGFEGRLATWASAMEATLESLHGEGDHAVAVIRFPGDAPAADASPVIASPPVVRDARAPRIEVIERELPPAFPGIPVPGGSHSMLIQPLVARAPAPTPEARPPEAPPVAPPPAALALVETTLPSDTEVVRAAAPRENRATLLVLHNDLEALLAALMVANSSAAQGMHVEVYFAFWGIHLLRGERPRMSAAPEKPGLMQRMLLWMVPKGPGRQKLGKLHMGGIGTRFLLGLMRKKNILALDKLIEAAVEQGVEFKVCSMSMGLMGLSQRDIINLPNLDFAGVTSFAESASKSAVSLVF